MYSFMSPLLIPVIIGIVIVIVTSLLRLVTKLP